MRAQLSTANRRLARALPSIGTVALLAAVFPRGAGADAPPTLSGTWSASPMVERWAIGDWGEACGPKPSPQGAPGGTVTIAQQGSELSISGAGRSYSTARCWEQAPGLGTTGHSGGARGWRTSCSTAANDPRSARVVTTLSATDTTISFDETGQYQFVLKGQNCTASVRRTRSFRLIQREGEAPVQPTATATATATAAPTPSPTPTPTPAPTPTAPAAATPPVSCAAPGAPARIEVRPSRKIARPGDRFAFRASVLDAAGCPLDVQPAWSVATPGARVAVGPSGLVTVGADAADGTVDLFAAVGGRGVRVTVEIAGAGRYEALLSAGGYTDAGEVEVAAAAALATESIGAGAAVAHDGAKTRRNVFLGIAGAVAAVLAVLGAVLLRRGRVAHARAVEAEASAAAAPPPPPPPPPPPRGTVCPRCGSFFGPEEKFCGKDGTSLVPVN